MLIIRLRVNEKIYKHLMWFLNKFTKEELQVIEENKAYLSVQEYLKHELAHVEEGKAEFISIEQLDKELEDIIRRNEA